MKDAHNAESDEKACFRFVVYELWVTVFTIHGDTPGMPPVKKNVVQKWPSL